MARKQWQNQLRLLVGAVAIFAIAGIQPAGATDLTGCWEGDWSSGATGHRGPLQATFCRTSDARYSVEFRGRFFKVLPFRYSVTLDVVYDDGETVELAGQSYLGRMFGTFTYRALATETAFTANYSSCDDHGRFVLCRTCCCR